MTEAVPLPFKHSVDITVPATASRINNPYPPCGNIESVEQASAEIARKLETDRDFGAVAARLSDLKGETGSESDESRDIARGIVKVLVSIANSLINNIIKEDKNQPHSNCAASFVLLPSTAKVMEVTAYFRPGPPGHDIGQAVLDSWDSWPGYARWQKKHHERMVTINGHEYLMVTMIMQNWSHTTARTGFFEVRYRP